MSRSDIDVLVCGAGAAGLTLAIELARRGVAFAVVDKLATPFPGSRGKGLQPRTLEVFEDLGVLPAVLAAGGPYPQLREHRADGSHVDSPLGDASPTPAEPYAQPWMCPQWITERILRERLAALGHTVQGGCELLALAQDAHGVDATLRDAHGKRTLRARYLVGCDGGRSTVRQLLDVAFPGHDLGMRALVADLTLEGLSRDAWHRFGSDDPARQLALCPLAGTELFQLQTPVPPEGEVDISLPALQALLAQRSGRSAITLQAVHWASVYRMSARLAARYRTGRVFLAGDAAHVHPPTGGQGLNTSVQDACNLGWKLAAVLAGAPDALLDSYEAERRPVAADMLGLSTSLLEAAKRGELKRSRATRQLDVGYRGSPLNLEAPARHEGLRAGDRAPDAPLVRAADDTPVRLFELLAGTHWTALGHAADADAIAPHPQLKRAVVGGDGELADPHGYFQAAWALPQGSWALLRPDGYLAAVVDADHAGAMRRWLGQMLGEACCTGPYR